MIDAAGAFAIATFHSTHLVLKAEKILKEAGIEGVRLVPVPSQISSDCGVTVRLRAADVISARRPDLKSGGPTSDPSAPVIGRL